MRNLINIVALALLTGDFAATGALPSAWRHTQQFDMLSPGLAKISLPVETLDAARPALEDLRLCDDAGNELPFLITRPVPSGKMARTSKSFRVLLDPAATHITLETGLTQPLDAVTLETPAQNFVKSVRVDYSDDGATWRMLVPGQPIFHHPNGARDLKISLPPTAAKWLRLTIDDQRSQPVPFTGARIYAAEAEIIPSERHPATIAELSESPGETRITLDLGAANLDVASVQIETDEPLFTRTVRLAVPQVTDAGAFEHIIGQGDIYRVAVDGQPAITNLVVPLESNIRSRELFLLIRHGDSPPLPVRSVRIERRPVYLTFMARQPGTFHLMTGNKNCPAPHYDLAALGTDLKNAAIAPVKISALAENPAYRPPTAISGLDATGAPLDISDWKYRKPISVTRSGAQQIELDLDVLGHAAGGFADLRLMRGSNQVPFITQRTSISRAITPTVTMTNSAKNLKLSRWLIKLPKSNLPITRLTCTSSTPVFQRDLSLNVEYVDERGYAFFRQLAGAKWTQTPERRMKEFVLQIESVPPNDTLILQTENGDNPAIELDHFTAYYPATRILFNGVADEQLYLYYGNPRVAPPSYDLGLVADELLAADKSSVKLGAEELFKKSWLGENQVPGSGGVIFWGILAFVVIILLAVVARLLPKAPAG